ncbi:phosphoribosylaminoimidazole synthetase [Acidobacteria bacterium Mor1]|nr:phosphoribosylaminoimidazole synthetase [Acidobacteria bacterium Mor1]
MSNEDQKPLSYRDAGVDIDAQEEALSRIGKVVASTRTPGVMADLGSFGGMYDGRFPQMQHPVLVSSADGVGTKLRVAVQMGIHDTVGRDLVNHCVNDILVQGARPLYFMDYVGTGVLEPGVLAAVVEGVAAGCRDAGCALLGGETAEMPGFYGDGEYDVVGFIVGVVDRDRVIDGARIEAGDSILGLHAAGLHTNGFSLARKIFFEVEGHAVDSVVPELGRKAGEVLLDEHRSYHNVLRDPIDRGWIRGLAHITGGGLTDNLPRVLPAGTAAEIRLGSWEITPVFSYLQEKGKVAADEMYRAFNMGVGMAVIPEPTHRDALVAHLEAAGERPVEIGKIVAGDGQVSYV